MRSRPYRQKTPYQEAAKALMKMFAERANGDGNDLLEQILGLAVEHAFRYGTMRLWLAAHKYDHDCGLWGHDGAIIGDA